MDVHPILQSLQEVFPTLCLTDNGCAGTSHFTAKRNNKDYFTCTFRTPEQEDNVVIISMEAKVQYPTDVVLIKEYIAELEPLLSMYDIALYTRGQRTLGLEVCLTETYFDECAAWVEIINSIEMTFVQLRMTLSTIQSLVRLSFRLQFQHGTSRRKKLSPERLAELTIIEMDEDVDVH